MKIKFLSLHHNTLMVGQVDDIVVNNAAKLYLTNLFQEKKIR